jgi:pyruvate/2-oxoglutarate dehydrogenase complex dihydrolipoamide acyltransferase (E2) component
MRRTRTDPHLPVTLHGTVWGRPCFRRALYPEAEVAVRVADGDERLEAGALAGARLLLDGHDLHHLVLELVLEEVVDDFSLLHGEGEEEDLLDAADLALLHEAAELGDGDPHVLLAATAPAAAPAAPAAATAPAAAAPPEAAAAAEAAPAPLSRRPRRSFAAFAGHDGALQ